MWQNIRAERIGYTAKCAIVLPFLTQQGEPNPLRLENLAVLRKEVARSKEPLPCFIFVVFCLV